MLRHQLNALMVVRRAMGDIGTEVVVRHDSFEELLRDDSSRVVDAVKASRDGFVVLNTVNGPTMIRRAE